MEREPQCLICLAACTIDGCDIGTNLNIPGAGRCKLLNAELEQMFIAHQLLDMPKSWCEMGLKQKQLPVGIKLEPLEEFESGEMLEFPSEPPLSGSSAVRQNKWFNICAQCTNERIKPAWKLHQNLVAIEAKLKILKGAIKDAAKETILDRKKKKKWDGLTGSGLDVEIRRYMFPDLIVGGGEKKAIYTKPAPRCRKSPYVVPALPKVDVSFVQEDWVDRKMIIDWEAKADLISENEDDLRDEDFDIGLEAQNDEDSQPKPKKKKSKPNPRTTSSVVKKLVKRIRKRRLRPRESLKRFKCFECDSYFSSESELGSHTIAHGNRKSNGDGPLDCDKCSYPALSAEELARHMKNRHERITSRVCSKCNFKAKSWKTLKEHVDREHPEGAGDDMDELSLTCNACSRTFLKVVNLTIHKRKMHPELYGAVVDEPVECTQCGQKFVSKIRLAYHMENEHTEKPSKYVCDTCGKAFQFKCRLESHKVVHYNKVKRDYVCHLCGIDYARKDVIEKHYRNVHAGELDGSGSKTEKKEEFKCKHCDLTSPYKVVIHRHMQTHKMEAGHKCDKCGNFYMSEQGLRTHLKINHPSVKEDIPCVWCMKTFTSIEYMKAHQKHFCKLKNAEVQTAAETPLQKPPPPPPRLQKLLLQGAAEVKRFDGRV